jgi:hypothetical protein
MSNSSPPRQRPPRLRDDEPIALLIALLSFGAIFFWVLNQNQNRFSIGTFLKPSGETQSPQIIPSPTPQPSQADSARAPSDRSDQTTGAIPSPNPSVDFASPTPSIAPTPTTQPTVIPAPLPPTAETGQLTPRTKPPASFADVPNTYWAYPFITALAAQGIVSGFPDGTFKPDQPVKRAEFAVQLQKAYVKPSKLPAIAFTDIPKGDWRSTAVDQAVKGNFMSGYPDKTFRPDQQVSRMEAAVAMTRGLDLPQPADPEAILQSYQDQEQVPTWARSRIAAAIQAGLFSGDPDTKKLNPNQAASRADIAALIYSGQKLVKE